MSKVVPIFPHGNIPNQKTIPCIATPKKAIIAVIFGRKISDFPSTEHQTKPNQKNNNMDKFLENQASNHAFHCASVWHNSKKDHDAKRYFESEKKVTLMSYSNRPEFAEKFNAVLAYYMVRENFIKESNEAAH